MRTIDMTATGDTALRPALSVWEENLFSHFVEHTDQETAVLAVYEDLAESSPNEFVRYLAALLLEDERRHHRIFTQLANTMVSQANLISRPDDVPSLTPAKDGGELRALTERLIALEEDDKTQLARLRKELKPVRDTTIWDLLVQLAERDTEKHLLVLRFIAGVAKGSP
ncbi:MAG TPA: hypothetical protein VGQ42_14745 [Candidatus Dormibacteraeota bacterium]|nr:hypothetical protein [Candidatus Dormibacteraeota bacterium]